MSYLCISHATDDQVLAERFCRELKKYGYQHVRIHENTAKEERDRLFSESVMVIVLTSPAAAAVGTCASDIRRAAGSGKPCVCVSLSENELNTRYCGSEDAVPMIPYPAGDTDTPDERAEALFVHRLYVRRLSRLAHCFSPSRCVDDAYGRAVTNGYKAHKGDVEAQYALGQAYAEGIGLPVLESESAYWIGLAADAKHLDALIRMGELRIDGEGVEQDQGEALRLFSAAAHLGDPRGQFARGICCLYGYGVMKDPEMAFRYFKAAAREGYAPAHYRLGLLYRDGLGVVADRKKAIRHLYIAAVGQKDIPPYLYGDRMAPRHVSGKRQKQKFVCVSMRFMRQKKLDRVLNAHISEGLTEGSMKRFARTPVRAERARYPEDEWLNHPPASRSAPRKCDYSHQSWNPALAESALGRLLALGSVKDGISPAPCAALAWYRRSVLHGHVGAVFRLGDAYRGGCGVPRDPFQAVKLFHRAAEMGSRRGQFALGICYERGEGVERDPKEAVRWYELAAKGGYTPAQNNLGGCYEHGMGVATDYAAAVEWYTRASAEEEPNATCRLGLCYENGRGVTQSYERAFHLYETAARHKHPYALYRLALYYDRGITVDPQVAYAAHLYERAAMGGVGDAAYAMALCCGEGRGVRKNPQESMEWLKMAVKLDSVRGCYALGMAYYEGKNLVRNKQAAERAFTRAVEIYRSMHLRNREDADRIIPTDGLTLTEAVGKAYYMLGYGLVCDDHQYEKALYHFKQAAALECGEAMTAAGDMYAHGLLDAGGPEENERAATTAYEAAATRDQTDALLSLAIRHEQAGKQAEAEGKPEEAQYRRESALRALTKCAKLGDPFALVGLAGCYWLGYGTPKNRNTAYDYLRRANGAETGEERWSPVEKNNTLAALWLGDLYATAPVSGAKISDRDACHRAACDAYVRAIEAPFSDGDRGRYLLPVRRQRRRSLEEQAKAEARYRLSVLRMTCFSNEYSVEACLMPMAEAVLAGHEQALDDLTRWYLFDKQRSAAEAAQKAEAAGESKKILGRLIKSSASRDGKQGRDHENAAETFGTRYYAVLMPTPTPFTLEPLSPMGDTSALSDELKAPVTDVQRAETLNHLGDRYFYGQGVKEDQGAAVACYRRAAAVTVPRGQPPVGGIVWAQYSLGYCLLHGIGTERDPRGAVKLLTAAAKYHGEAALCLAECHMKGMGVDRADTLEALKYYRRALKFGQTRAAEMISLLESRIGGEG